MPVVDNLELRLQSEASSAIRSLDQLISRLDTLSGALVNVNSGGLNRLSLSVRNLSASLRVMSGVKTTDYTRISNGLNKLSSVDNASIGKAAATINTLASSVNKLEFSDGKVERLKLLADGVATFGRAGVSKAITNLPLLGTALQDFFTKVAASPHVENNLIGMTSTLSSLISGTGAYASTINNLSTTSKVLTKETDNQTKAQDRLNRSLSSGTSLASGFAAAMGTIVGAFFAIKRLITGLMKSIKSSMDFTETINLFETAFRKIGLESGEAFEMAFLDRAYEFNEKFTSMLTLDPDEIMNYQARFGAMSNSMGVVGETAFNISGAFTALGADIASLFNIDIPVAMQKLQSGLAGQIRPLRDLGVDIAKTSLSQTAMNYGITESIEKMSAATKVQLRFLTTIRQMRMAMGDMARTINNPANQLRILQEQWRLMARAFGNIFMPVVARVLPYLNAVLIAITKIMNRIASAFGFKLPSFKETPIYMGDMPDPMEGLEDDPFDPISSGAGNATDKVKELKKALAGFDELNVLNLSDTPSDSGGGGGGGSGGYGLGTGSGYGILDEAIADEWFNYQELIGEAFDNMANKAKGVAEDIYNSLKKFEPFFKGVWQGLQDVGRVLKWVYDVALKPLIEWIGQWIADNPEFIEGLGRIQGWVWGMIGLAATFKLAWGGVNFLAKITGLSTIAKLLFGGKVAGVPTTVTKGTGILGGLKWLMATPVFPLIVGGGLAYGAWKLFEENVIPEEWKGENRTKYQENQEVQHQQVLDNREADYLQQHYGIPKVATSRMTLPQKEQMYDLIEAGKVKEAIALVKSFGYTYGRELTGAELATRVFQQRQLSEFRKIESGIITTGNAHLTLPDKVKTAMGGADSTIMGTNTSNWGKHLTEWTGGVQTKTKSAMDNVAKSVGTGTSKALDEFGRLKNQSLILTEGMSTPLKTSATKAGSSVSSGIKSGTDQATRNTDTWARAMPGVMNMLGSSLLSTATSSGRNIPKGLAVGQNTAGGNMTSWTGGLLTQFSSLGGGLDRIMVGSSKAWSGAFVNNLSVLYNNLRAFARMIGVTLPYYWSPSYSRVSVSYSPTTSSGIKDNRLNISAWASGGQPPIGQLFYAREAGAELVGNVGGRTTVMNNDQIVESVATGVANAVASVLGGGTNQPIIVQVGSDTLVDTVINGLNRRSRAMGSPVALGV